MDLELSFLVSLLKSNSARQKAILLKGVDLAYFLTHDVEADYILKFYNKYKKLPSFESFRTKFKQDFGKVDETVEVYYDKLLERKTYSELKKVLDTCVRKLGSNTATSTYETAELLLKGATSISTSANLSGSDLFKSLQSRLARYEKLQKQKHRFYDLPYPTLNKLVAGVRPENLITLCARPSVGKSWISFDFMLSFWKQGAKCLIISKEMSRDEVEDRLDAMLLGFGWDRFLRGKLNGKELIRFKKAAKEDVKELHDSIIIEADDTLEGATMQDVRACIVKHKPDVVLVDGAYLIKTSMRDLVQASVERSRTMKRLAKEQKVILMQTEQMNRAADRDGGGSLSNLQWTDATSQDSDYVFELVKTKEKSSLLFKVLKGRNSAIGDFYINFGFNPLDFSERHALVNAVDIGEDG